MALRRGGLGGLETWGAWRFLDKTAGVLGFNPLINPLGNPSSPRVEQSERMLCHGTDCVRLWLDDTGILPQFSCVIHSPRPLSDTDFSLFFNCLASCR